MTINQNEKAWELVFDPRSTAGDEETSFIVGSRFDRLNLKESVKAGVFYTGMCFMHVGTHKLLIVVESVKGPKRLVLCEANYSRDWV